MKIQDIYGSMRVCTLEKGSIGGEQQREEYLIWAETITGITRRSLYSPERMAVNVVVYGNSTEALPERTERRRHTRMEKVWRHSVQMEVAAQHQCFSTRGGTPKGRCMEECVRT